MLLASIAHVIMRSEITSLVYVIGLIDFVRAAILVSNPEFTHRALCLTIGAVNFLRRWSLSLVIKRLDPKYIHFMNARPTVGATG